jgi:hypothetical protein
MVFLFITRPVVENCSALHRRQLTEGFFEFSLDLFWILFFYLWSLFLQSFLWRSLQHYCHPLRCVFTHIRFPLALDSIRDPFCGRQDCKLYSILYKDIISKHPLCACAPYYYFNLFACWVLLYSYHTCFSTGKMNKKCSL